MVVAVGRRGGGLKSQVLEEGEEGKPQVQGGPISQLLAENKILVREPKSQMLEGPAGSEIGGCS